MPIDIMHIYIYFSYKPYDIQKLLDPDKFIFEPSQHDDKEMKSSKHKFFTFKIFKSESLFKRMELNNFFNYIPNNTC